MPYSNVRDKVLELLGASRPKSCPPIAKILGGQDQQYGSNIGGGGCPSLAPVKSVPGGRIAHPPPPKTRAGAGGGGGGRAGTGAPQDFQGALPPERRQLSGH